MIEPYNAYLDQIRDLLGDGWNWHTNGRPVMAGGHIYSMACEARYRLGSLVVYVNVDRGAYSILVGTDRPDDMYPFEDLAVHCRWCDVEDLHRMIDDDAVQPLMPLPEALELLADNAADLNAGFALENAQMRNGLREVAYQFHVAWDARTRGRDARDTGRGR